jgi:hypothetical protein
MRTITPSHTHTLPHSLIQSHMTLTLSLSHSHVHAHLRSSASGGVSARLLLREANPSSLESVPGVLNISIWEDSTRTRRVYSFSSSSLLGDVRQQVEEQMCVGHKKLAKHMDKLSFFYANTHVWLTDLSRTLASYLLRDGDELELRKRSKKHVMQLHLISAGHTSFEMDFYPSTSVMAVLQQYPHKKPNRGMLCVCVRVCACMYVCVCHVSCAVCVYMSACRGVYTRLHSSRALDRLSRVLRQGSKLCVCSAISHGESRHDPPCLWCCKQGTILPLHLYSCVCVFARALSLSPSTHVSPAYTHTHTHTRPPPPPPCQPHPIPPLF